MLFILIQLVALLILLNPNSSSFYLIYGKISLIPIIDFTA